MCHYMRTPGKVQNMAGFLLLSLYILNTTTRHICKEGLQTCIISDYIQQFLHILLHQYVCPCILTSKYMVWMCYRKRMPFLSLYAYWIYKQMIHYHWLYITHPNIYLYHPHQYMWPCGMTSQCMAWVCYTIHLYTHHV